MSITLDRVMAVNAAYIRCIDTGALDAWPDFFVDDCIYKVTTADNHKAGLAAGLTELCRRHDASGVHVTFMPEDECRYLAGRSFLERTDQQFHWLNDDYANFDAFLEALTEEIA